MADYRLKITESNWHSFNGQLDAWTHDELKVGDVIVQCAGCKRVFAEKYLEGSDCPFGHPFVPKKINTGPITLSRRGANHRIPVRSAPTGTRAQNPTQRASRSNWGSRRRRRGRDTLIPVDARQFVKILTWGAGVWLAVAVVAFLIVVLAGGKLELLKYRGTRWNRQLISLWKSLILDLGGIGGRAWHESGAYQRLPRLFNSLWQYIVNGVEQLLSDPRAFFEYRGARWNRQVISLWKSLIQDLGGIGGRAWHESGAYRQLPRLFNNLWEYIVNGVEQLSSDPRAFFEAIFRG